MTALLVSMQCFDIVWKSILTSVQIHKKAIQFKIQSLFFYNYYNKKRIMQYWHKRVLPISKKYTKKNEELTYIRRLHLWDKITVTIKQCNKDGDLTLLLKP